MFPPNPHGMRVFVTVLLSLVYVDISRTDISADVVSLGGIEYTRTVFRASATPQSDEGTIDIQYAPSGDLIAAWARLDAGTVVGRRFDSDGVPQTGDFQILSGNANFPQIASRNDGTFIVVAQDRVGRTSQVAGRIMDAGGNPVTGTLRINGTLEGHQFEPKVTQYDDGSFFAVWHGTSEDGFQEVLGRQYSSSGTPATDPFVISQNTSTPQKFPKLDSLPTGETVVVWGNGPDIAARQIDDQGLFINGVVPVTDAPGILEINAAVAMNDAGESVILWEHSLNFFGQRYDQEFNPVGDVFLVNQASNANNVPNIDMRSDGTFAVTWKGFDGDQDGIYLRLFGPDAQPLGDEILVNADITGDQFSPQVSFGPDGRVAVAWRNRISINDSRAEIAVLRPVPEPASLALLAVGGFVMLRRR